MKRKQKVLSVAVASALIVGMLAQPGGEALAKKKKAYIAKKKITLEVGGKGKISIKKKNKKAKAKYLFKTKSKKIKVSKKGKITALKTGKATVTVWEKIKKSKKKLGKVKVTVVPKAKTSSKPTVSGNPAPADNKSAAPSAAPSAAATSAEPSKPAATGSEAPKPSATADNIVYNNYFEDGEVNGFVARGDGNASIEVSNSNNHTDGGMNCLSVINRTATWNGAQLPLADLLKVGSTYQVSAWVKQDSGNTEQIAMKLDYKTPDDEAKYVSVVQGGDNGIDCESGNWVELSGEFVMPESKDGVALYFEVPSSEELDFLIDDVVIRGQKGAPAAETFSPTETKYKYMVDNGVLSTGNNAKVKNAIEKARAGEEVTLAYIGGSITEGALAVPNSKCYAEVSANAFAETYGKDGGANVHFINAGMSGTPSAIGVIRYQRDVIDRLEAGDHPDILFIEFSVNDYQEVTKCGGYEGIIRQALKDGTAVVLIFSVFQTNNVVCENEHRPYGQYYELPMVSMGDAIKEFSQEKGFAKWYYGDNLHPNNTGYQLMSDCIMNLFDKIEKDGY